MDSQDVYIVAAKRTPIGSFGGALASVSAVDLGAQAMKSALEAGKIDASVVERVFMGNVLSANVGQAPAQQAAQHAGIAQSAPCTTVNKVCASGMEAIILGAQSVMLGVNDIVVAGGMENMSQAPFYSPETRWGQKYGNIGLVDAIARDGLSSAYTDEAMGCFGDLAAKKYDISRQEQDDYAIDSYKRATEATDAGHFATEIAPVSVPQRKGESVIIDTDEEHTKVKLDKIPVLRPVFSKDGTVTAANASTINDGAAAVVLVGHDKLKELGVKPLARIVAFAESKQEPEWFTTTPVLAAQKALQKSGLKTQDIDYFEVNEAFAVVAQIFEREMSISHDRNNIFGGAVAIGHPIGASGARIVTTLTNILHQKGEKYGLASICNGGGGASALIVERL
ncbi:MAG: acetyl-CoA C-acyltransferase [Alphaproteobacteria bacterium]|nr:acetyl-CoA C-acyltransferase [Alphaproteobacteria bacterium]